MSKAERTGRPSRLHGTGLGVFAALISGLALTSDRVRAEDPWPMWGRTATRLGNTPTVGPQTPTIAWRIRFDSCDLFTILEASPVMDAQGRIFVKHVYGVTAVNSITREVLWEFDEASGPQGGACVWGGCVLFGDSQFQTFYCLNARTGEEIWREENHFVTASPVVSPDGVVYFVDQQGFVCARRVTDGSEVWTRQLSELILCSPSLDWPALLVSGESDSDVRVLDPLSGLPGWVFPTGRSVYGLAPIVGDRLYVGSWDSHLYCVNVLTGGEEWRFFAQKSIRGAVAVTMDGTVYCATLGGDDHAKLFGVSPAGNELWRYPTGGNVLNAPIVAGDGTIYVCSQNNNPRRGFVHAVRPDGSVLWIKEMPDQVSASPMLAPDGTLYVVCRDKYLYAFHDPPIENDSPNAARPTAVHPVPPP